MRRLIKRIGIGIYALLASYVTLVSGCKSAMPTRIVPFAEEVGIEVPNFKGWTFVFLNEMRYKYESEKVKMYGNMMEITHQVTFDVYDITMDWVNMALAGGALGGIPLALRKVPKGFVKDPNS